MTIGRILGDVVMKLRVRQETAGYPRNAEDWMAEES